MEDKELSAAKNSHSSLKYSFIDLKLQISRKARAQIEIGHRS